MSTRPVQTSSTATQTHYSSYATSGGNNALAPMRELEDLRRRGLLSGTDHLRLDEPRPLTNRVEPQPQAPAQDDEEESGLVRFFAGATALAGLGYTAYNYWYPETSTTTNTTPVTTTTSSQSVVPQRSASQEGLEVRESRIHFSPPPSPQSRRSRWEAKDADDEDLAAIRRAEAKVAQEAADAEYARQLGANTSMLAKTLGAQHRDPYGK